MIPDATSIGLWQYILPGGLLSGLGIFMLRKILRADKFSSVSTRSDVSSIARLSQERDSAVNRADDLSDQLHHAFLEMGEIRSKLGALSVTVDHQTEVIEKQSKEIERQSGEIAQLRAKLEAKS